MSETRQLTENQYAEIKAKMGRDGPVGGDDEIVPFEARGGAAKLFSCRDDEILLSGAAGTGKSRAALEYAHLLLNSFPNARALFVRKTLVSLTETGLVTYRNQVLHRLDGVFFRGFSKSEPARFVYPNGSSIIVGGLDAITKIMSSDYDLIYVQEANEVSEPDWEMLTTRLRNGAMPFQQIIGDVNPQEPWHWILRRSADNGPLTMIESRHEDNPRLFTADGVKTKEGEKYIARLENLTGTRLQRLRYGRWVAAEGLVYEEFNHELHVIDDFRIPDDWTRIRMIDFGFVNPFVALFLAQDKEGVAYVYREWYRTQMIVADHAERILQLSGKQHFVATVADHDSEDRATLQRGGIQTIKARKQILPGIEAVQKRLRVDEHGKAKLYIMRGCLVNKETRLTERGLPACLIEEMASYAWPPEVKDKTAKEVPLDLNNHACFVAGTMVLTPSGEVPIERIAVGDTVCTPIGPQKVTASSWTDPFARIYRVLFDNGYDLGVHLEGTLNHPIFTERGWQPIGALRYNDTCLANPEASISSMPGSRPSSSTARPIGDTPTPQAATRDTSRQPEERLFTGMSTKPQPAQSQRDGTFIIGTGIRSTTIRPILSLFRRKIISRFIRSLNQNDREWSRTSQRYDHMRPPGTAAQKEELGTPSMAGKSMPSAFPSTDDASTAARISPQSLAELAIATARTLAKPPRAALRALTTLIAPAWYAALFSALTSSRGLGLARVRVVGLRELQGRSPVYNIAVENAHCYYANGVLVSNCDALRYGIMYLEKRYHLVAPTGPSGRRSKWVNPHGRKEEGHGSRGSI